MNIEQEFFCEFSDEPELELIRYASIYHDMCEQYDKSVCSHINERGIAMPATGEELSLINQHAKSVYKQLGEEVTKLGFSYDQWHNAVVNHRKLRYLS